MTNPRLRIGLLILTISCALVPATPAVAGDAPETWVLSLGIFDFIDSDKAVEVGVQRRFSPFRLWRLDLVPMVGVSATDEESVWLYAGLRWDLSLGRWWVVTPNFAASLYEDGDGKDLGGVVEFRSGLEVARRLAGGGRIGLLFYHLSNSRIYEHNPGSESLVLTWSF